MKFEQMGNKIDKVWQALVAEKRNDDDKEE